MHVHGLLLVHLEMRRGVHARTAAHRLLAERRLLKLLLRPDIEKLDRLGRDLVSWSTAFPVSAVSERLSSFSCHSRKLSR